MIKLTKVDWKVRAVLDKDENPKKVTVDTLDIALIRTDYAQKTLEVTGFYGYVEAGKFVHYTDGNGSAQNFAQRVAAEKDFSDFLASVSKKGAKLGNFRIEDVEDFLIEKGIVKGERIRE